MTTVLDETHDAAATSWVRSANGHPDFPLQNLPLGTFAPNAGRTEAGHPRPGVALGDAIVDLSALREAGLLSGEAARFVAAAADGALNEALALGAAPRRALRKELFALFREGAGEQAAAEACLYEAGACTTHLPARVGDYTDFYVGIHHATAVGTLFRPDSPLMPNYKWVPIGYHGRASSVRPSGVPVRRPNGQTKAPDALAPTVGPCRRLDFELEMAVWIGAGNAPGEPIPIGDAHAHIAGYGLLNDWSARDIQAWEYQPLGPFLAKSFATTVSPWIVTPEALAPFRAAQPPRPDGDPLPLPYLHDPGDLGAGALSVELHVLLSTPGMRAAGKPPVPLARSHAKHMYWTPAQIVTHHASGGCDLRPGDLLGTGTISGPDREAAGALLELTDGGRTPVRLPNGESRTFLEDGDEVILRGQCHRAGFASIGFGDCRAAVLPAPPAP